MAGQCQIINSKIQKFRDCARSKLTIHKRTETDDWRFQKSSDLA